MTTSQETLGRRIARLRLAKAATQERLARELKVSPQAISKWENDSNYPDIALLPQLAQFLGVTVDELLSGVKTEEREDPQNFNPPAADKSSEAEFEEKEEPDKLQETSSSHEKSSTAVHLGKGSKKHGLHIYVESEDGDVVDMCVPMALAKFAMKSGLQIGGGSINKETREQLENIDIDEFVAAAKDGESGTLINVVSADGDIVKIWFD